MIRFAVVIAAAALGLAGCQSTKKPLDYTPMQARFFLEAPHADGMPITLPQSGVRVAVNGMPVITEGDIMNVELVQVDLGQCLLFQLTPSASRDFYRLSVSHQGKRVVVIVNGEPLGARRIDGPISNGALFVFIERPEAELPLLVSNLKKSAVAIQREIAKRG